MKAPVDPLNPWAGDVLPTPVEPPPSPAAGPLVLEPEPLPPAPGPRETWHNRIDGELPLPQERPLAEERS